MLHNTLAPLVHINHMKVKLNALNVIPECTATNKISQLLLENVQLGIIVKLDQQQINQ